MKTIMMLVILLAGSAYAHDDKAQSPTNSAGTQNVQYCNQEPCETKTVYMTYKQQAKIKALEAEVARLKAELEKKPVYTMDTVERIVVRDETRIDAISLIVPYSPTKLSVTKTGPGSYHAQTDYELDLGLMYQHDFDWLRGSVSATVNGSFMLGAGIAF